MCITIATALNVQAYETCLLAAQEHLFAWMQMTR